MIFFKKIGTDNKKRLFFILRVTSIFQATLWGHIECGGTHADIFPKFF
jgi:hypothetical protein